MRRWTLVGVLLSVGVHAGLGAGIARIPKDVAPKHTLVSVFDKKKKEAKKNEEKPRDEPPPPPKKEPPRAPLKPKAAPENTPPPPPASTPPPSAAAHPQLAALPNLGISMAGGPGGGVGIAVPLPQAAGPADAARAVEGPAPKPRPKDDCPEDAVKPKLVGAIPQDRIIAAAQAAGGVEGRIRLELQVDEGGNITSARVISGLGGAIDEAAVSSARRAKVTASTKCGRPVAGRLVVAMTIRNPD
jgi:periplasmic protein TonB